MLFVLGWGLLLGLNVLCDIKMMQHKTYRSGGLFATVLCEVMVLLNIYHAVH